MGHGTSACYHHVHLADDLTQFDHSEAVHAAWIHTEIFPLFKLHIHSGKDIKTEGDKERFVFLE